MRQQNQCKSVTYLTASLSYQDLGRRPTETTHHQRVGPLWVTRLLTVLLKSGVSVYSTRLRSCWRRTFWAHGEIKIVWCDTYIRQWLFWETITVSHVCCCCYTVNHNCMHTWLLRWRLNLTLQISQGSASTYFRWSGHFRQSFVKGSFRDHPSNFYWNRFIFYRKERKISLQSFFEIRCSFEYKLSRA